MFKHNFSSYIRFVALVLMSGIFLSASATPSLSNSKLAVSPSAISVSDIVELSDFSGVGVCESHSLIATRIDKPNVQTNAVNHRWKIFEWPSGMVLHDIDAGESIVHLLGTYEIEKPHWSPNCGWLYYRALRGGELQVWGLNVSTGKQQQLTQSQGNVLAFQPLPASDAIIIESDIPRSELDAAESRLFKQGALIDETMYAWSPLFHTLPLHGEWRAMRVRGPSLPGHLLSHEPKQHRVVSLSDQSVRDATTEEIAAFQQQRLGQVSWVPNEWTRAAIWSPDGYRSPVLSSSEQFAAIAARIEDDQTSGHTQKFVLARVHRDSPTDADYCSHELCTAETIIPLAWSLDDENVYFISERGMHWEANIFSWAPKNGEVRPVFKSGGMLGGFHGASRSFQCPVLQKTAICTVSAPTAPPRLEAIELGSGVSRTLLDPNHFLRRKIALKSRLVHWTDKFERTHNGILTLPRNFQDNTKYPLVITTYRCPGFHMASGADGGPEHVLAEHGFVVLCIDRNDKIPPYAVTSKESIGPSRYVAALAEYKSAIDYLAEGGFVDRERVGATGMSFSSQAISFSLTHSDIFGAVATTNIGVFEPSWEAFLVPGSAYAEALLADAKIGENGNDASKVYSDISVAERADRVSAAVLVQSSDREYLGSLEAVTKLMASKKPVEMHVFPDETHNFHQPVHRYVNLTRNVDWFRFWLQDYEDPDPEKAAQYERWRELRKLRDKKPAPVN